MDMRKLHQQIKQQGHLVSYISKDNSQEDEGAKRVGSQPRKRSSPSPRAEYPVPAPREDKKTSPSARPRKESLLAERRVRLGDSESMKTPENKSPEHTNKKKDQHTIVADRDKGDVAATDSSAKYANVIKDLSSNQKKPQEISHPPEPVSNENSRQKKKEEVEQTCEESGKRDETQSILPKTKQRQLNSLTEKPRRPQAHRPCVTEMEHQLVERLRHELLTQDDVLSRYKSASSFLEKFAQSQLFEPTRRQREVDREHEQPEPRPQQEDVVEAHQYKTKDSSQVTRKTSDTVVIRKRGKTVQKIDPKVKKTSQASEGSTNTNSGRLLCDGAEPYDSAVLRAIKAEEEHEKIGASVKFTSSGSKIVGSTDKSETSHKKTVGEGDYERGTTHEAGRRLAKLRKRLEDSLEQIQNQPGLDRELFEKARSAKMKRRREELEKMVLLKSDTLDHSSLSKSVRQKEVKGESDTITKPAPAADTKPSVEASKSNPESVWPSVSNTSDEKAEVADGEPNTSARQKPLNMPQVVGMGGPAGGAEKRDHDANPVNSSCLNASPNDNIHTAGNCTLTASEQSKASAQEGLGKLPENNENTEDEQKSGKSDTPCKVNSPEQVQRTEIISISENVTLPMQTTKDTTERSETVGDDAELSKFVQRNEKVLDENSLDAILERRSKRREQLRHRRRSPALNTSAAAAEQNQGDQDVVKASDAEENRPKSTANPDAGLKQEVSTAVQENYGGGVDNEGSRLSPTTSHGAQFLRPSTPHVNDLETNKAIQEEVAPVAGKTAEEKSPLVDNSDSGHSSSKRSLRHLKYEEPEVQLSKNEISQDAKSSPEKLWCSLDREIALGLERESSVRRRVRWRRQAERAERQRTGADDQKTPPPIPPKLTRLNDIIDNNVVSQNCSSEEGKPPTSFQDNSTGLETKSKGSSEGNTTEDTNTPALEKSNGVNKGSSKITVSPRLVRGSFICTIRDRNTSLAAGETGLVKSPPENVEICEEKSLTPSKAASVFDPKAQLEREKEKQEAERAARSRKMEGMPSPQFKANVHLFEHAGASDAGTIPSPDSKVKANVRMFEEASRAQRDASVSPELRARGKSSRSPSSPRDSPRD